MLKDDVIFSQTPSLSPSSCVINIIWKNALPQCWWRRLWTAPNNISNLIVDTLWSLYNFKFVLFPCRKSNNLLIEIRREWTREKRRGLWQKFPDCRPDWTRFTVYCSTWRTSHVSSPPPDSSTHSSKTWVKKRACQRGVSRHCNTGWYNYYFHKVAREFDLLIL